MKILSPLFVGVALLVIPTQMAAADDSTTSGQTAPSTGSTSSGDNSASTGTQGQRGKRLKHAFAQLGLTDAQREQIKQIRASVTDRKERRQEIMAVLTPDQKAKLRELIQEHKNGAQSGAGTPAAADNN